MDLCPRPTTRLEARRLASEGPDERPMQATVEAEEGSYVDKGMTTSGRKKVGRPITFKGDINSPHLTEEDRRRIKRRVLKEAPAHVLAAGLWRGVLVLCCVLVFSDRYKSCIGRIVWVPSDLSRRAGMVFGVLISVFCIWILFCRLAVGRRAAAHSHQSCTHA
jgi:hypothetical protein